MPNALKLFVPCVGPKQFPVLIADRIILLGKARQGKDDTQLERQRYGCKACQRKFDDLTNTVFAGHHQPLKIWVLCLYFMGLNLSNTQIARELDLNEDDVQQMTQQLRSGIVAKKPEVILEGEVECDEVYVVAGHKGQPNAVKKKAERVGETG